ncbi:porin [Ralstonia insidiosa]|uniref:Porin domain-containing protein n=1 Tax=Ralstonia insidiosa TaxID=190721 RepID=A0A192A413_9RALS|nr:porin [Ralstonia insidiosa]ANJ75006.1 hypothetical protein A9Y76_20920 [Ralstonia insidiosa]MBY4910974.1 porin [Ralstonia insidiosa]
MGIAGGIRAAGVIGLSVMGSAYAQSNVTLYGTVENALSYTTHVNAAGDSLSGMSAGILTTSRWGMRGREDLGQGWGAVFDLEQGFSPANGATQQQAWSRESWVGLEGPYGRVTLGRTYAPILEAAYMADPLREGTGTASVVALGQLSVLAPGNGYRLDKTIRYTTPASWGPISGSMLYAFGSPGSNVQKSDFGAHLMYGSPSLTLVAGYNREDNPWDASGSMINAVAAGTPRPPIASPAYLNDWKRETWMLGANYTIDKLNLYAGYSHDSDRPSSGTARRAYTTHLYWAGAAYWLTSNADVRVGFYKLRVEDTNIHPYLVGAQLDYYLSKNVDVYLLGAFVHNQGGAGTSYPVVAFGTSAAASAYGANTLAQSLGTTSSVTPGTNQFQAAVGVRYRF